MDYRLKLVKYLVENSGVRSREYERMGIDNIRDMIDPDHWNHRFHDYPADVEWCRHILKEAKL